VLDGAAAGIYLDRAHSGPGTPGSGSGADIVFSVNGGRPSRSLFMITCADAVALDGNPHENDLYAKLVITFPSNFGSVDFEFMQDTDPNVFPEPGSRLLIATALAATLTWRVAVRNTAHRPS
jgi:hypothetical protein